MPEFRWDHVHLRSPDPEGTAQYYVDVFGATPVSKVKIGEGVRVIISLAGLNLFIEQVPAGTHAPPEPPHLGLEHFGLAVTNIDAVCAELKGRGAEFVVEPHTPRPGRGLGFALPSSSPRRTCESNCSNEQPKPKQLTRQRAESGPAFAAGRVTSSGPA